MSHIQKKINESYTRISYFHKSDHNKHSVIRSLSSDSSRAYLLMFKRNNIEGVAIIN